MTVSPTTVRLSMLSHHHQQLLKEILDTVGVSLPPSSGKSLSIRLVNDITTATGSRGRSQSRGRSGVRQRSTSRPKTQPVSELMKEFRLFFASNNFRNLHAWVFRPIPPASLVAKIDSVLCYISDYLQRDERLDIGSLVMKFFTEKLGLKNLVEVGVLDLLYSSLVHRKSIMEVDTFVRCLTNFYDSTDILFHNYVKRSVPTASFLISFSDCVQIARNIFGPTQEFVAEAVIDTLSNEMEGVGSTSRVEDISVHVSYFIYITVWVFHHQRNDLDIRSSQHGFEDVARQSFQIKDKNLIDSYVDSILELKTLTKQLRQTDEIMSPMRESHIELESAVRYILTESCKKHKSSIDLADHLMQAAMNEDRRSWANYGGTESGWAQAVRLRDQLLQASDSPQMESFLRIFCDSIASSAAARTVTSYH
jgi:hypothetical protein